MIQWLEGENIMDYSLLLGIHELTEAVRALF